MEKLNLLDDEKYMRRCLQLALNGKGSVAPNPMVGAVVVHKGIIIGEGFHREYGKSHAEVNAINSVKDKSLLKESTIYVSLEPCSHHGKTPPCSQLILDRKIPRVVVATLDPYFQVSGRGVDMLKNAGVEVEIGMLEKEAQALNKEFFLSQIKHRPYIYLKWAQTKDGFIDKIRVEGEPITPTPISNRLTRILLHKVRSEVSGIMVATNTAVNDNPSLTTRFWFGRNPVRVVLDRTRRIPANYNLYDNSVKTLFFTQKVEGDEVNNVKNNIDFILSNFDSEMIPALLKELNKRKIDSLLVEGGASLLQSFIDCGIWDEAYIEIADRAFVQGIEAPRIDGTVVSRKSVCGSESIQLKNV